MVEQRKIENKVKNREGYIIGGTKRKIGTRGGDTKHVKKLIFSVKEYTAFFIL